MELYICISIVYVILCDSLKGDKTSVNLKFFTKVDGNFLAINKWWTVRYFYGLDIIVRL